MLSGMMNFEVLGVVSVSNTVYNIPSLISMSGSKVVLVCLCVEK